MDTDDVMREGAKRIARESSARLKVASDAAVISSGVGSILKWVAFVVVSLAVSFVLALSIGCRAASGDVRESIPLLQERVEAYMELSAPRSQASEEEQEAREALEERIREQLNDLVARMND